jgi:hypothetical protein
MQQFKVHQAEQQERLEIEITVHSKFAAIFASSQQT